MSIDADKVRRTRAGAIDIAYYERRARRLRARWMRRVLRAMLRGMLRWHRRRLVEAELRALDDRSLRDLGIGRGDIPSIADGSYARDRSRRRRGCIVSEDEAARAGVAFGFEPSDACPGGEGLR